MRHKKTAAIGTAALLATGAAVYEKQSTPYTTYIYGSENKWHDIKYGWEVNGAIKYGGYCVDPTDLMEASYGDVVISMRANSADYCRSMSPDLPTIAIVGWDNANRFIGDDWIENSLVISSGANWGKSINYYVGEENGAIDDQLSASMPAMANIVNTVNQARRDAELPILVTTGIRLVLDASSDEVHEVDGRYYGQLIDLPRALEIATAPTSTPITVDFMNGVYYLLLRD